MKRARRKLGAIGAAAAMAIVGVVGAGVVGVAQEQPSAPPSDAGLAPPPTAPADAAPTAAGNIVGEGLADSAPPDEAAPPRPIPAQAKLAPAGPLPPPPPPPPPVRPRFQVAVLQAVDKVTAETLRFEAKVGERVRYRGLVITVRACEGEAVDEARADNLGYLEVDSQPVPVPGRATIPGRQVFRGWMAASSTGLNPLQNASYDVWVIACKTPAPEAPPGQA